MEAETRQEEKIHHGHNIARYRNFMRIKQRDLAERLNIHDTAVSEIEQKEVLPKDVLEKYANAIGIPVSLLENTPDNDPSVVFNVHDNDIHDFKDAAQNSNQIINNYYTDEKLLEEYKKVLLEIGELKAENARLKK